MVMMRKIIFSLLIDGVWLVGKSGGGEKFFSWLIDDVWLVGKSEKIKIVKQ